MESVVVIIPVLNEEETIAVVIQELQRQGLTHICVVDNGSCDRTSEVATQSGAHVIVEPHRGYGQACWRGLRSPMATQAEWILFCDGDGSDDLSELGDLLALREDYDLILGNRRGTTTGRSQLTPVQNFGNWLATRLIHWGWGQQYEDLGPLRLIRKSALDQLAMADRGYGWTVEMQAKAANERLRICERPVNYRPRQGGRSKISGTLTGSLQAGQIILTTLAWLYWQKTWPKTWLETWLTTWQTTWQETGAPIWQRLYTAGQSTMQQRALLGLSVLLLVTGSLWTRPYGDFLNQPEAVPLFLHGIAVMSLGFALAWGLRKVTKGWFWLGAIAPRLILLAMHPGDDIWRYLWEGHIQTVGFNPYLFAPTAEILEPLRFTWWTQINHPDHAAIYPPITQLGFRLLATISNFFGYSVGFSILLFKLSFVCADIGICWLLSRRFGYRATLLYAWNPLVIYSFSGGGHYDSWFLLPLVIAWLWWDRPAPKLLTREHPRKNRKKQWNNIFSSVAVSLAVGVSIAVKWMSLPVLLFLTWQQQHSISQPIRKVAAFVALCLIFIGLIPLAIAAIPFCQEMSCPILPIDSPFVTYGRSAALVPQIVAQIWPASVRENWLYAVPLGGIILWNLGHTNRMGRFIERYFTALMLLSPIVHAWYFTWLVPFAVASRNWGTRLVSLSAFVYFALPHGLALGLENWTLSGVQHWALWGPFVVGLLVSAQQEKETTTPIGERPTEDPTKDPTESPIESPIDGPTEDPIESHTEGLTEDPIESLTEDPIESHTEGLLTSALSQPTEKPENPS